jgi:hypothetical protein
LGVDLYLFEARPYTLSRNKKRNEKTESMKKPFSDMVIPSTAKDISIKVKQAV